MTETEINERLEEIELLRIEQCPPAPKRKGGRCYRRQMKRAKYMKRRSIVTRHYVPHVGYVDWDYVDGRWIPVGKYIKYPKNSNKQQWLKRAASRKTRACADLPHKGNTYRRLFEHWWEMY